MNLPHIATLWPKISIVTPSYNQGRYVEETIRSVLAQNYPNLEYIIMDGGSTDNSVAIIKKYEPRLAYWVSEKDKGQADAIHRGFERATGEIIGWLNSDDYLLPGALKKVGKRFSAMPDLEFLVGGGIVVDDQGKRIGKQYSFPQSYLSLLSIGQFFMQMSSFWRRSAYLDLGGLDTSLRFCFDYELFLRLAKRQSPQGMDALLSAFRIHNDSKTSTIWQTVGMAEFAQIKESHCSENHIEIEQAASAHYTRQYHLNKRWGVIKDLIRDPGFFTLNVCKKL